ncbi:type II secretion system protein F [Moorella thermoacetica]|uniref:Type II secretion system protein F n=1 Tax=Neomoorella thermoacetica TaxID=1525 RepID=A0A1J5JEM1_NEOTH|nr:type II secretion system protein F [Moorella thermoacetica]
MLYNCKIYIGSKVRTITVEAASEREAATLARERAGEEMVLVARVTPAAKRTATVLWQPGAKVGPRDLELFCRRAQVLVGAGVTIIEAMEILAGQSEKKILGETLKAMVEEVKAGLSLAEAFRAHPTVFPPLLYHTIAAAEETGALEETLARLAEHFAREAAFREKIRQAVTYPSLVAVFAILVMIGLFTFVVPQFTGLLVSSGARLPGITLFIMWMAAHIKIIAGAAAGILVLSALAGRLLWQAEDKRSYLESFIARLPVIGKILSRAAAARVCRTMALLYRTGVPMVRALETVEKVASFASFRGEIKKAREMVREGHSLAEGLAGSRFLPLTGQKMIAVGESSGDLSSLLDQAASLFETEVELLMQKLPPMVEMAMLIAVGGGVGTVMLAMLLPILSVYQTALQ